MTQMWTDGKGTLNAAGQETVRDGLLVLMESVRANNFQKGWRSDDSPKRPVGELVALLHSEVTECFESFRNGEHELWYEYPNGVSSELSVIRAAACLNGDCDPNETVMGKPQGMAAELADVIIRVLDFADEYQMPIVQAVLNKHAYNQTRPFRHGGKAC